MGIIRDESCEGACNGQVLIDVSGGTPPYIGNSTDQSASIITSTILGDSILGDMCSGTWMIDVTDAHGCTSSLIPGGVAIQTVGYNFQTTAHINLNTITHVDCYGGTTGSLDVLNPNPIANYSYNWENLNNPGVSVGTGNSITNLPAGFYVLMAQYGDSLSTMPYDGCTSTDTVEVTESLSLIHI